VISTEFIYLKVHLSPMDYDFDGFDDGDDGDGEESGYEEPTAEEPSPGPSSAEDPLFASNDRGWISSPWVVEGKSEWGDEQWTWGYGDEPLFGGTESPPTSGESDRIDEPSSAKEAEARSETEAPVDTAESPRFGNSWVTAERVDPDDYLWDRSGTRGTTSVSDWVNGDYEVERIDK
jgi:hypothetical protein